MAKHDMIPNSETPHAEAQSPDACDYAELWTAVIVQALRDATLPKASCATTQHRYDRRVAHFWLTGNGADFQSVCENAGIAPRRIMDFYKKLRDEGKYIRGNGISEVPFNG